MSDNIPFELQEQIMKMLPVKSLLRFRPVCQSWKSLIDSSRFIARYSGQQQHLIVRYEDAVTYERIYVSVVDDDHTFPHQKVSVTIPPLVANRRIAYRTIVSSHGLLCLLCYIGKIGRVVIWNPCIRKAVDVFVPNMADDGIYRTVLGFGVCRETKDPKIVKVTYIRRKEEMEGISCIPRQVEVFTLSTGAWRSPHSLNLPDKSIQFDDYRMVAIDGVFHWLARDGRSYGLIISFDMTSEEFGEVNLPDSLAHPDCALFMDKLRGSLVVIEQNVEDNEQVFHVWMMEDGVPISFKKLYTIRRDSPDLSIVFVRGFRKTGEPLIEVVMRGHNGSTRILAAYDPCSKSISNVGINARLYSYFVHSCYKETLLLL